MKRRILFHTVYALVISWAPTLTQNGMHLFIIIIIIFVCVCVCVDLWGVKNACIMFLRQIEFGEA